MTPSALAGGRFRLERELGRGGMATVYLAHDERLGRPVAVKLLADPGDGEVRRRFLREARVAAALSHPNVVGVFDAGEEDGHPFIVMEHVAGRTVADVLEERGRLEADEAIAIVAQACAGLEHAHAAGLVHRDVKPGNLLVGADGTVKVSDFGIAHAAQATQLTEAGTILGSAAYLAPEQAAGGPVTPAADVYALGGVLYELLTGRPPRTADALAPLVQGAEPKPVTPVRELAPNIDPALEQTVMRALARRPERRQASAAALAAELTGGGRPADETLVLARPRRPRRLAAAAAVLLALAAGSAVAIAVTGDGDAPPPPPRVEPVPRAETPEEQARNLAEWLRAQT